MPPPGSRRNRVALCTKAGVSYLLLVKSLSRFVPKEAPSPSQSPDRDDRREGDTAGHGQVVVLQINDNGRLALADGFPLYYGIPNSLDEACKMYGPFDTRQDFPAAFGCIQLDRLYLLVATDVQVAAQLPFDREIYSITGSKWVCVPVAGIPPPSISIKDEGRIKAFLEIGMNCGYYFCDDADLEAPFPCLPAQRRTVGEFFECDFSEHLRRPFRDIEGVDPEPLLSTLLRGFPSSCTLPAASGSMPLNVMLLGRQNKTNAGPRYHSRGLNGKEGVGNDHIYELVIWRYTTPKRDEVRFARHVILRGTIPLNWRSELKSGIGEADVVFGTKAEITRGTSEYFVKVLSKLQRLFVNDTTDLSDDEVQQAAATAQREAANAGGSNVSSPAGSPPSSNVSSAASVLESETPSTIAAALAAAAAASAAAKPPLDATASTLFVDRPHVGLRCINLLRLRNCPSEELLSRHYVDGVRSAEPAAAAIDCQLDLVHHDWLNSVKDDGIDASVEVLWHNAVPFLTLDGPTASTGTVTRGGAVRWSGAQRNFVRVNCADSLDRTNVGCFFTCAQVALDMLRLLGVSFSEIADDGALAQLQGLFSQSPQQQGKGGSAALAPSGSSELMFDVNANVDISKREKLREPFVHTIDQLKQRERCPKSLLRAIAEMFVNNGDTVAMLYTNSGALHTNVIRNFVPGMKGASANAILSVQRRYENVFEDKRKFRCLETLLGRNLHFHYPTLFRGVFGICPIPHHLWNATIVVRDVPPGTRAAEIQRSLKVLWDEVIAARLEREVEQGTATVVVHSSALGVRVFESFDAFTEDPESPALEFDRSLRTFTDEPGSNSGRNSPQPQMQGASPSSAPASAGGGDATPLSTPVTKHVDCNSSSAISPGGLGKATFAVEPSPSGSPAVPSTAPATPASSTAGSNFAIDYDEYDLATVDNVRLVVVQFDADTCRVIDVAAEFLKLGHIPFEVSLPAGGTQTVALPIERYSYEVKKENDGSIKAEKIAKTLRSGIRDTIKSIVRRF